MISVLTQDIGQSVRECVVKPLCDIKVTGSKPAGTKNPTMLKIGVTKATPTNKQKKHN
jgi:hypothetical protein